MHSGWAARAGSDWSCQRMETADTCDVLAHPLQNAKTKPRLRKEARIEELRAFFERQARRQCTVCRILNQNGIFIREYVQDSHRYGA
jgi:hypothetical protein